MKARQYRRLILRLFLLAAASLASFSSARSQAMPLPTVDSPLHKVIVGGFVTHDDANFHMTYKDHPINCDNFPWYSRVFTKPHIEIENDPRVWAEAASLIDTELSGTQSIARAR